MIGPMIVLYQRELKNYFTTPIAYIFMVIFLLLSGLFTFYIGFFFERGQADLQAFFESHPWIYLIFIPALSMRLWAEERKHGTIEILMTLPLSTACAVVSKFLAAWTFAGMTLSMTFPIWLTVNYLGSPDNGAIMISYLGSWILAGGFLAVGAALSAFTKNQVVAYIISLLSCLLLVLCGYPAVIDFFHQWAPQSLVSLVSQLSFIENFKAFARGVIDLRNLIYFASLILFFMFLNILVVETKKAD